MPYIYNPDEAFKCPEVKEGRCNFAFNKNIAGMKLDDIPGDVVLLFESEPGWNQVGGPELLASEAHKRGRGIKGCNVAFADGIQRFVKKEDLDTLRWEP